VACPSGQNSTAICTSGHCGQVCSPGYADCNASPFDGCETNILTDPHNCGGCSMVCGPGQTCSGGVCTGCAATADCSGGQVCRGGICTHCLGGDCLGSMTCDTTAGICV
jgi:hypothetical protein